MSRSKNYVISPELFDYYMRDMLQQYALESSATLDEITRAAMLELVRITKQTAPVGHKKISRPHFVTTITYKKVNGGWFGANVYQWGVLRPNYRLTHLLAKDHKSRGKPIVRGNPFLRDALETVKQHYMDEIIKYFGEPNYYPGTIAAPIFQP